MSVKVDDFLGVLKHDGRVINDPFAGSRHGDIQSARHVLEPLLVVAVGRTLQLFLVTLGGLGSAALTLLDNVATLARDLHIFLAQLRLVAGEGGVAGSLAHVTAAERLTTAVRALLTLARHVTVSRTPVHSTGQQLATGL